MKITEAVYTGTHQDSFRSGEKGLITGVKMVLPDKGSEYRACFEVTYSDGVVDYFPISDLGTYEVSIFREKSADELEIERLARIMCEAENGEGTADLRVSMSQMPVTRGGRSILPRYTDQKSLWRDYYESAVAVIKDRGEK